MSQYGSYISRQLLERATTSRTFYLRIIKFFCQVIQQSEMYEKENNSRDYVSSDHEDEDRNSLRASEVEEGFLSGSILDRSQQLSSNTFYRKWVGHLFFTVIWVISLFAAVILLRYDGNHAKVGLANIFDTELREWKSTPRQKFIPI